MNNLIVSEVLDLLKEPQTNETLTAALAFMVMHFAEDMKLKVDQLETLKQILNQGTQR